MCAIVRAKLAKASGERRPTWAQQDPFPSNPRRMAGDGRSRNGACRRQGRRSRQPSCNLRHGTRSKMRDELVRCCCRKIQVSYACSTRARHTPPSPLLTAQIHTTHTHSHTHTHTHTHTNRAPPRARAHSLTHTWPHLLIFKVTDSSVGRSPDRVTHIVVLLHNLAGRICVKQQPLALA